MWLHFFWQNFHFAINLLAALTFFSIFWLYFDAWWERRTWKEGFKVLGFLLLSLSFLAHALLIESPVLSLSLIGNGVSEKIAIWLKISGYLFLIIGLVTDPLIPKPKLAAWVIPSVVASYFVTPVLAAIVAWLYLRRATIGLENHTKKISLGMFLVAIWEILTVSGVFVTNLNVNIFRLVAPFGPVWIASHSFLLVGVMILIGWAFSYLLKRINTQMFIIFTTTILTIFLITTVSFTFLLLKNLSEETLSRLNTDVAVLSFALESKKSEALASATILAKNNEVAKAVLDKDKKILENLAEELVLSKKVSSVLVVDGDGKIVARGEDKDQIGGSLSENNLVKRALVGESLSSVETQEGAVAPMVLVKSIAPIKSDNKVIGAVIVSLSLDNNFLDGVKKITGLEVTIYGGEILSATTISDLEGKTRPIGIRETNKEVKNKVLNKGEDYSGLITFLNTSYFAVYHPLKNINNENTGMILAGKTSASIYKTAGRSIELTFLITIGLIVLSVFPSFFISKYIFNQIK